MQKSRIVIVSSQRNDVLAEKLRDQLDTNYTRAHLWKDALKDKTTETRIEMLEEATQKYDFAVIILCEANEGGTVEAESLKDRDNRIFETGYFLAALGRERCFIVNSAEHPYLPQDLAGFKPAHFKEPETGKMGNREACADAIRSAGSQILDLIGKIKNEKDRPLSKETLLEREQKRPEGELGEHYIVVNVTQPLETGYAAALNVRQNMEAGIDYTYCFHGGLDCVLKICQLLQMLLIAPLLENEEKADYSSRKVKLMQDSIQKQVIADLERICESQHLKIYLLPNPPELEYVIHNANSETDAILYVKHKDSFIVWEREKPAYVMWVEMRKKLGIFADVSSAVFCGAAGFDVKEKVFYGVLKKEMKKVFPGIDDRVLQLCCDGL